MQIRRYVTQTLCTKRNDLGRNYISGSTSIFFDRESWIFIVEFFKEKQIVSHGPFRRSRKELQMRAGMELNAVHKIGDQEILQFITRSHFKTFDLLFGRYSRIGTSEPNPSVGEIVAARLDHHIFHMGSGMFAAQYVFMKQRGRNSMLGVDLQYDDMNGCLGLSLRYCKEKASDNLALSTII